MYFLPTEQSEWIQQRTAVRRTKMEKLYGKVCSQQLFGEEKQLIDKKANFERIYS